MHESRALSFLTVGALLVLAVVVVFAASRVVGLDNRITHALSIKENRPMQTLTTKVTRSSTGDEVTVVTPRDETETTSDFVARHNTTVDAVKAS